MCIGCAVDRVAVKTSCEGWSLLSIAANNTNHRGSTRAMRIVSSTMPIPMYWRNAGARPKMIFQVHARKQRWSCF